MRDWIVERAPDGTPLRMRWMGPGFGDEMDRRQKEEKDRNRTLRYVEPSPYGPPPENKTALNAERGSAA